jgi:hypothetical protein
LKTSTRSKDRPTRLEAPADKVETVDVVDNDIEVIRKAIGSPPDQDSPVPLWLKARARTVNFRHHELAQTHWKKVWRSMVEE